MAKSTFGSENAKKLTVSEHFLKFGCSKMAVAKSTFGSENAKKLTVSEHFLKFGCSKMARRCGEKHIWK